MRVMISSLHVLPRLRDNLGQALYLLDRARHLALQGLPELALELPTDAVIPGFSSLLPLVAQMLPGALQLAASHIQAQRDTLLIFYGRRPTIMAGMFVIPSCLAMNSRW